MKRSVHDNFLIGYSVDSESKEIILHTEYQDGGEPFERTDVVFKAVVDHYFINSLMPSIIFDVEEADPSFVFNRDKQIIKEGFRVGGWPSLYEGSIKGLVTKVRDKKLKVFQIQSSYGMDGWVICDSCDFVESNSANKRQQTNL